MNNIGDRIKQKRKELGLTQIELSAKLNISDRAVSKWEQGEGTPNLSIIPDIAEVLGVSLDYLLLGNDEEQTISLDDMDTEKRLSLLIKKDDVDNFRKYDYLTSEYVFGRKLNHSKSGNLCDVKSGTWTEIIEHRAIKIFNLCCDELIKKNSQRVWAAFLIDDFLDDFVKMVVDAKRPDVLDTIGFRMFAVNKEQAEEGVKRTRSKFLTESTKNYSWSRCITEGEPYFIKPDTLEYIFQKREASPECFDYATTFEFQIIPLESSSGQVNKVYTRTYLQDDIVDLALQYKMYDVIKKALQSYKAEISSSLSDGRSYQLRDTYLLRDADRKPVSRVIMFKSTVIESLLKDGQVDFAMELNDYNKMVIKELKRLRVQYAGDIKDIPYFTDSEISRFLRLNSEISDIERTKILCVKDKILVLSEVRKLRDLKLVKELLDNNYYHYYEFVYDMLSKGDLKSLLEFFVDIGRDSMAKDLIGAKGNYSGILESAWSFFCSEPKNSDCREDKMLLSNQNELNINRYKIRFGNIEIYCPMECKKQKDNQIIEYIKSLKDRVYEEIESIINKEKQDQKDAMERAKLVKGLDKGYFEGLLAKEALCSEQEKRLFILDLCSLFDTILKFDYHYEGEDFYERMTSYFNAMKYDDGYEYVLGSEGRHLQDLFNRLRIQRNNIAHSESQKVEELSESELRECLEYVFSVNKGGE